MNMMWVPIMGDLAICRTKHALCLVSRRCNEALREPCEAWAHLSLHAHQFSKVATSY